MSYSIFSVRDNVNTFGKAYAFYAARKHVGTIQALYMIWTVSQMNRHHAESVGLKF